eukprot:jgi/Mesvir1/16042/Mv08338-RA.1
MWRNYIRRPMATTNLTGIARRLRAANAAGVPSTTATAPVSSSAIPSVRAARGPVIPVGRAVVRASAPVLAASTASVGVAEGADPTPEGSFYEEEGMSASEVSGSESASRLSAARSRSVRAGAVPAAPGKTGAIASSAHAHEQYTRRSASTTIVWPAAGGVAAAVCVMRFLPSRVPSWFKDPDGQLSDVRIRSIGLAAGVLTFFIIRLLL